MHEILLQFNVVDEDLCDLKKQDGSGSVTGLS